MKSAWIILLTLSSAGSFAVSEELLLTREAELLIEKTYITNTALIDIDPVTCKPSENSSLMLKNLKASRKGILTHCKSAIADKLSAIEEDLKQVNQGVLLPRKSSLQFSNAPQLAQPPRRLESETVLTAMPEVMDSIPMSTESSNSAQTDHTGLSQEERDRIKSYYDSSRRDYNPKEDDGLFTILSKAYIRNLNRIFSP